VVSDGLIVLRVEDDDDGTEADCIVVLKVVRAARCLRLGLSDSFSVTVLPNDNDNDDVAWNEKEEEDNDNDFVGDGSSCPGYETVLEELHFLARLGEDGGDCSSGGTVAAAPLGVLLVGCAGA